MNNDLDTSDLIEVLSQFTCFKQGYIKRSKLIELGDSLSLSRTLTGLSLEDVAKLTSITTERLDNIEMGTTPDSVTLIEVEKLLAIYSKTILLHGGQVRLQYQFITHDGRQCSVDVDSELTDRSNEDMFS